MKYKIFLEPHVGVSDFEEEFIGEAEGHSANDAIRNFAATNPQYGIRWVEFWHEFVVGASRRVLSRRE